MRRHMVREYFNAWVKNDAGVLKDIFAEDVRYSECFGPEYHGINQILTWFDEWHMRGRVLEWNIKSMLSEGDRMAVEWNFLYEYDGKQDNFDGVSLISFREQKIIEVKEFEAKSKHYAPYGE